MIPRLYYKDTHNFTSTNCLGYLPDCISCTVIEGRNDVFELEMQYPIIGLHYDDIQLGRVVVATYNEDDIEEPFVIYRRTAVMSGIVTFNAYHISYLLSYAIMRPQLYSSPSAVMQAFYNPMVDVANSWFYFTTDISSTTEYRISRPSSIRSLFFGTEGSLVDVYGGEFKYNDYEVGLFASRGSDNGVTIRYGKNLTDITDTTDISNIYSSVIPYWEDSEGNVVYGSQVVGTESQYWTEEGGEIITDENNVNITFIQSVDQCVVLDLSNDFENQPTAADLEAAAATYLANNTPWIPNRDIEIDFVALWQTEEYKNIAPIERVKLCDTVHIIYEQLGVIATAKVIKTEWNTLLDRYNKIELGKVIDQTQGFTGKLTIGGKVYKIINGLILSVGA